MFWKKLQDDNEGAKFGKNTIYWILNFTSVLSLATFWANFFGQRYILPEPIYILIYIGLQGSYTWIKERLKRAGICEPRFGEAWVGIWLASTVIMVFAKTFLRDSFYITPELIGVTVTSLITYLISLEDKFRKIAANNKSKSKGGNANCS